MKNKILVLLSLFLVGTLSVASILASEMVSIGQEATLSTEVICPGSDFGQRAESVVADTDGSDGYVLYLYGAWVLSDTSNNIIQQQLPTQIGTGSYTGTATFVAEEIGTYKLNVAIMYAEQQYDSTTNRWETTNSGICSEGNDVIEVLYPEPDIASMTSLVNQIFQNWISGLSSPEVSSSLDLKVYYLYYYQNEFDPDYESMILSAIDEAGLLLDTYEDKEVSYSVDIEAVKIDNMVFGGGESVNVKYLDDDEFRKQEFMKMYDELIEETNFMDDYYTYYKTVFIFEGTIGTAWTIDGHPIYISKSGIMNRGGYTIVHEDLHEYECLGEGTFKMECFMRNSSIEVLDETSLCGCYNEAWDMGLHTKVSPIILREIGG